MPVKTSHKPKAPLLAKRWPVAAGFPAPSSYTVAATALLLTVVANGRWTETAAPPTRNALHLSLEKEPHKTVLLAPGGSFSLTDEAARLAEAERLIENGKIHAARRILLEDLISHSPDAALMLARTYDPNYLRTIAGADGGPDIAEAERWYRTWHGNATRRGLIMEPERLNRIIRSMR